MIPALTVAGVWCVAATAAAFLLGRVIRRAEETREDDWCALIDATAEPFAVVDLTPYVTAPNEPTPIAEAAWVAAIERAARIEAACEDFAAEVAACADRELAELIEGEK